MVLFGSIHLRSITTLSHYNYVLRNQVLLYSLHLCKNLNVQCPYYECKIIYVCMYLEIISVILPKMSLKIKLNICISVNGN